MCGYFQTKGIKRVMSGTFKVAILQRFVQLTLYVAVAHLLVSDGKACDNHSDNPDWIEEPCTGWMLCT